MPPPRPLQSEIVDQRRLGEPHSQREVSKNERSGNEKGKGQQRTIRGDLVERDWPIRMHHSRPQKENDLADRLRRRHHKTPARGPGERRPRPPACTARGQDVCSFLERSNFHIWRTRSVLM